MISGAWAALHTESANLAAEADQLWQSGAARRSQRLYARAAELEEQAYGTVAHDKQRTRGVLSVSCASLWLKSGLLREAQNKCLNFLQDASLPEFARSAVREVLHEVANRQAALIRKQKGRSPPTGKQPAIPKRRRRPDVETLKTMPTEELWTLYRRAAKVRPIDADWIETLRNVLMELHYPLVKHIAERLLQMLPNSIELDDLVSAGLFGLLDAIRGFDPSRGITFKTSCTTRIRGSILDQLRSQDWVPRLVRLEAAKIEKALRRLQVQHGREPTHGELVAALEMERDELAKEITGSQAETMLSLAERWDDRNDDNSVETVDVLVDKNAVDPIHELNRRDVINHITRSLTYKERFIIEQYYHVGLTMREIGEMLALTEKDVCQIHSNVMTRMHGLLSKRYLDRLFFRKLP